MGWAQREQKKKTLVRLGRRLFERNPNRMCCCSPQQERESMNPTHPKRFGGGKQKKPTALAGSSPPACASPPPGHRRIPPGGSCLRWKPKGPPGGRGTKEENKRCNALHNHSFLLCSAFWWCKIMFCGGFEHPGFRRSMATGATYSHCSLTVARVFYSLELQAFLCFPLLSRSAPTTQWEERTLGIAVKNRKGGLYKSEWPRTISLLYLPNFTRSELFSPCVSFLLSNKQRISRERKEVIEVAEVGERSLYSYNNGSFLTPVLQILLSRLSSDTST